MRPLSNTSNRIRALLMTAAVAAVGLAPPGAAARPLTNPSIVPHNLNSGVFNAPTQPVHQPTQSKPSKSSGLGGKLLGLHVPPQFPGPKSGSASGPTKIPFQPPLPGSLCAFNPKLCAPSKGPVNIPFHPPPPGAMCLINPSLCTATNTPAGPAGPTGPSGPPAPPSPPQVVVVTPPVVGDVPVVGTPDGGDGPTLYQGPMYQGPVVRSSAAAPQSCFRKTNLPDGSIQLTDVCTNQQVMVPPGGNACLAEQDATAGSVWFADTCMKQQVLTPPAAALEALQLIYKGATKTSQN